jgi:hypothetical protein
MTIWETPAIDPALSFYLEVGHANVSLNRIDRTQSGSAFAPRLRIVFLSTPRFSSSIEGLVILPSSFES